VNDLCRKVKGAYCRPGMRGCILIGKVQFQDGLVPYPIWPEGADPRDRAQAEEDLAAEEAEHPSGSSTDAWRR
jgi:hypothetical protein